VLASLGVEEIDQLEPAVLASLGGLGRARLLQAEDMCMDPDAAPGWRYTNAEMLQAQGRGSAAFAPVLRDAVAPRLDGLVDRLRGDNAAVLDVGVGVAALSIALARMWPRLRAVGIDNWEPALAIARQNVDSAGLTDRICLRLEDVSTITDADTYDLIWMPVSFIAPGILKESLDRLRVATRPGGWVLMNMYGGMDDLTIALAHLRTVRSGGAVLLSTEAEAMLAEAGFQQVRTLPQEILPPVTMIVGRR